MKEKLSFLNSDEIEALKEQFEVLTFPNDFDVVYENQIPSAGIALIEGEINLIKKSKVEQTLSKGCLLGINQLLMESPVRMGVRIRKNSQIVLLGKSEILNLLKNKRSKLSKLFKSLKIGK